MNEDDFKAAYNEPRNGTNDYYKHSINNLFVYTDGVRECAMAGCYWLLDILATEGHAAVVAAIKRAGYARPSYLKAEVDANGKTKLALLMPPEFSATPTETDEDGFCPIWSRTLPTSSLPEGSWDFIVSPQNNPTDPEIYIVMCLLSED